MDCPDTRLTGHPVNFDMHISLISLTPCLNNDQLCRIYDGVYALSLGIIWLLGVPSYRELLLSVGHIRNKDDRPDENGSGMDNLLVVPVRFSGGEKVIKSPVTGSFLTPVFVTNRENNNSCRRVSIDQGRIENADSVVHRNDR
jgi:hypothetical protein